MEDRKDNFVESVMKKNVVAIDASGSIKDAAVMMSDARVGCIVVTDGKSPVGIVTERDIVRRIAAKDLSLSTQISEIMSKPLIVAKPDYTLWELAQLMKTKAIHKMPVEKDGNLVGIITATDLVKLNCLATSSEICKITEDILARAK